MQHEHLQWLALGASLASQSAMDRVANLPGHCFQGDARRLWAILRNPQAIREKLEQAGVKVDGKVLDAVLAEVEYLGRKAHQQAAMETLKASATLLTPEQFKRKLAEILEELK